MLLVACDKQLPVQEARAGKPDAWDALFRRYQLPLYVYVCELVPNEQTSLDIVQETFINAARHIGSLQKDEKFGSWLFSIAHQKCIQHWRRHRLEEVPMDEQLDEGSEFEESPHEVLIRKEQEEAFMKLMGKLPLPQRTVLLLYFVEDFSLEEIAGITGAQLGTVKSRMHYAKETLRKLMEEKTV
jgi:RNA polymerase sigma-70 factor (ECF subfamily)